ncbi:hypothetical protein G6F31_020373 [Rhizopus arrhizus]|nr:hypothetical protein G6F31_020373 [Rhizopus arrhizus]
MQPYQCRALTARVPALTHEGFNLTESSVIAEYLEDVFPAPEHAALYPQAIRERARARQLQAWLRSDLGALRQERPTETVFYGAAGQPLPGVLVRRMVHRRHRPGGHAQAPGAG